ncbi:hypothetical protein DXG01_010388 [Tephrocybe rancida]|nr:hypothetical protein DXG01_010388 [Tephrocybe rancida]
MAFFIRIGVAMLSYLQKAMSPTYTPRAPPKDTKNSDSALQPPDVLYDMMDEFISIPEDPTGVVEWATAMVDFVLSIGSRGTFARNRLPMKKLQGLKRFKIVCGPLQHHYYIRVTVAYNPSDLFVNLQRSVTLPKTVKPPTADSPSSNQLISPSTASETKLEWIDIPNRVTTIKTLAILRCIPDLHTEGNTVECLTPDTEYVCDTKYGVAEQTCVETIVFDPTLHHLDILDVAIAALVAHAHRSKYNKFWNQAQWYSDLVASILTRQYEHVAGMRKGESRHHSRSGEIDDDGRSLQYNGKEWIQPPTVDIYENVADELYQLYAKTRQQLNEKVCNVVLVSALQLIKSRWQR